MNKRLQTTLNEIIISHLVEIRKRAGLSQRNLAAKLNREHSMVARIELGQRRVDLLEYYRICKACGADPQEQASELMATLAQMSVPPRLRR